MPRLQEKRTTFDWNKLAAEDREFAIREGVRGFIVEAFEDSLSKFLRPELDPGDAVRFIWCKGGGRNVMAVRDDGSAFYVKALTWSGEPGLISIVDLSGSTVLSQGRPEWAGNLKPGWIHFSQLNQEVTHITPEGIGQIRCLDRECERCKNGRRYTDTAYLRDMPRKQRGV